MSNTNITPAVSDPAYADHDPLAYMIGNGVEPSGSFMDYSPAQARGLVQEARSAVAKFHGKSGGTAVAKFHGKSGGTAVTFTDENRPRHLRTVRAYLSTSR